MDCTPIIVGITGGSGAGKSTLAGRLLERFGADTVAFSHDDYYKHLPDMTPEEALVYDFDSPNALDTWLLVKDLRALKAGRAVEAPSYDFAAHARTEGARHVEPAPVVLVEGLLIMCDPELLGLFDLVVFVDADPDVRALRRVARDCHERGATLERAIAMYLGTTKRAHDTFIEPFKKHADIIIYDAMDDRALDVLAQGIAQMGRSPRGSAS